MSRPRQFDLICFDWDGTLFDSTAIIVRSIQQAVLDVGGARPTDQAAAYVIGMALMPALAHAAPDVPARYPRLMTSLTLGACLSLGLALEQAMRL